MNISAVPGIPVRTELGNLLELGTGSDITFRLFDDTIPAHKNILLIYGGAYFSGLISHPMKENTTGEVAIIDTNRATFKALLEFIYTGQCVSPPSFEALADLLIAADKYQVEPCLEAAKGELLQLLKWATVAERVDIFQKLLPLSNVDSIKAICVRGLLAKWDKVVAMDGWGPDGDREVLRLVALCRDFSFPPVNSADTKESEQRKKQRVDE
ncbi:hypothetical protein HDV00_007728 [Rhizophlyctis rosea]|nr:hypothetical protein HDV00_007728 [Rhizophlyctis rosea]